MQATLDKVDHIVFGAPELEEGIHYIEALLGVRATIGGQHLGKGTWNALIYLGPLCYFEIIAPDPTQAKPKEGAWMGVDQISTPQLLFWAAKVSPIKQYVEKVKNHAYPLGPLKAGSRKKTDGTSLSWQLTDPVIGASPSLPFLIEWGDSPHPAESLAQACSLSSVTISHPEPIVYQQAMERLDLEFPIVKGPTAQICFRLDTPKGIVEICG